MKTKFKIYNFIIIATLLLNGCESFVDDVRLPKYEKKLVLAAFLSPADTNTFIYIGSNRSLFGELNKNESPGNLSGTISNGTNSIALNKTLNGLSFNRSQMPVEPGKTYNLKINSDLGLSAEAECTVPGDSPMNISVDNLTYVKHETSYGDGYVHIYYTIDFGIAFNDIYGEKNFYRMAGSIKTYMTSSYDGKHYVYHQPLNFPNEYLTDKGVDGTRIRINETVNSNFSNSFSPYDSAFLEIFVYKTDEPYQLYHKSMDNYNDGENPFSEVTPVFSNVEGGLGIFCSYLYDSTIYRLK